MLKKPFEGNSPNYVDITGLLSQNQSEAAKAVNLNPSTFSKRWRLATNGNKKWPHRAVKSIEKQIQSILENMDMTAPVPDDVATILEDLLTRRQTLLQPVKILI